LRARGYDTVRPRDNGRDVPFGVFYGEIGGDKAWCKPEPFYEVQSNSVMIGFYTDSQFPEKFPENETQRRILEMMLANPKASRDTIAAEVGITTRGVQKSINSLKKAGIVNRVGPAKGGDWIVEL
jgi:ATP-dependent DNA helicase RecG